MKQNLMLLFVLGVGLVLAGCSITQGESVGAGDAVRPLVVIATARAIQKGDDPAMRAAWIAERAQNAKTFLDGQPVTLLELDAAIRDRLDIDSLSPADRLLADELVRLVVGDLQFGVDVGTVDDATKYRINEVLDWMIYAASVY